MLIEVIAGQSEIKERRRDDGSVMFLKQEVYAHFENTAYPVRAFVTIEKPLQPGKYIAELPFKTGKFGDIEISPFDAAKFTPARPEQVKAAS